MTDGTPPEALEELFWSEEVTELLFWWELSGLGASATVEDIERLAPPDADFDPDQLDRLVDDGFLIAGGSGYQLTDAGRARGARLFVTDPDLPPLRAAAAFASSADARSATEIRALHELRAAIEARMQELAGRMRPGPHRGP